MGMDTDTDDTIHFLYMIFNIIYNVVAVDRFDRILFNIHQSHIFYIMFRQCFHRNKWFMYDMI
jgi:hypothetical protein